MKIFFNALLVVVAVGSLAVIATESVDEIKIAEPEGRVLIDNTRGEIRVFGWDKSQVRVKGDLDDQTEKFVFKVQGHVTEIRVKVPRHTHFGDGSELDIYVPEKSKVKFNGVSSDFRGSDLLGGISVHTVSGDVRLDKVESGMAINTVSGDIVVTHGSGEVEIMTVSGSADLDVASSEVSMNAVSGDLVATLGDFEILRAQAVSGDIDMQGNLMPSGTIGIETVSGDVDLELGKKVDARISIKTGPGGDIKNYLTDDEAEDIFPAQMKLQATVGDGSGRIRVNTVTGDIVLKKD